MWILSRCEIKIKLRTLLFSISRQFPHSFVHNKVKKKRSKLYEGVADTKKEIKSLDSPACYPAALIQPQSFCSRSYCNFAAVSSTQRYFESFKPFKTAPSPVLLAWPRRNTLMKLRSNFHTVAP